MKFLTSNSIMNDELLLDYFQDMKLCQDLKLLLFSFDSSHLLYTLYPIHLCIDLFDDPACDCDCDCDCDSDSDSDNLSPAGFDSLGVWIND